MPVGKPQKDTPAPGGKKPFYISHYGCSAAYYLEHSRDYDTPYATLKKADDQGMLTTLGKDVMRRLQLVREDAHDRADELTEKGARQMRLLAQQMADRFPDIFVKGSIIDARSIVRGHSILSMQEAMIQLSRACRQMDVRIKSSHSNDAWLDVRDRELEADRFNAATEASFDAFQKANIDTRRLMASLFVSEDYVKQHVNATQLSDQLFIVAGSIQNTSLDGHVTLYDIFTPQELYQHWRMRNAKNFISFGQFELNGGHQAYSQRAPLWNLMHIADSIRQLDVPVAHLRFSSRGMVLSLVCLMELNGYGLKTASLDEVDKRGWIDYQIAPFGANVQVVHYRKDKNDDDILIKVLLNGQEARLPIPTDMAPYYHWQDAKRYYLRKVYAYEKLRGDTHNHRDN